ncbi:ABC transporter substrate-binding protein [Georhizobium profundi]|uniref:ABC transporter substrate-binding protein n=1 Tax=Georhizobium profundi TaxID=2341112 RepID=UPI001FDFD462|nr:ABC transporter substrate-binding protein [Georhizobium profundi]
MSTLPKITVACFDHDRVMPVMDGRVPVEGFEIEPHVLPTSKLFPLAVQEARFDVTELSLSSQILQVARGEGAYVAIPAFISRAFRHNGFFRRTDSGVETPADLKGRRVGVPEYQMTAALWMRGILKDQYGVEATDIEWRTGALDAGVRHERLQLTPPPNLKITPISEGETLQSLLLDGQIDALLAPNPRRLSPRAIQGSSASSPISNGSSRTISPKPGSSQSCTSWRCGARLRKSIRSCRWRFTRHSRRHETKRCAVSKTSGSARPIV